MTDLEKRIDELERRSAEAALIAKLAAEPRKRVCNASLATQLQQEADLLKQRIVA